MGFSEKIKNEAKRKAAYRCVVCKEPLVQVHHIVPESEGGPNTLDNAAPLCALCHDRYGGNPDKRKQIREMRDFWWEVCETRIRPHSEIVLDTRLDQIQTEIRRTHDAHAAQQKMLADIKEALDTYYKDISARLTSAQTLKDVQDVTGIPMPRFFSLDGSCPNCGSSATVIVGKEEGGGTEHRWCTKCESQYLFWPLPT
jgi:hypothetical protein